MAANAPSRQPRPPQPKRVVHVLQLLLAGIFMASAVAGQDDDPDHGVVFIYPTKDQIFNKMDTVNVTYTSPFPAPNLYFWCSDGDGKITEALMKSAPANNATFPILLNVTSAGPCWFNLRPGTVAGFGANSPPFNILGQERSSGPMVFGPSSTPTTTSSSSTSTTTAPATSTSGTSTVNTSTSSSTRPNARTGSSTATVGTPVSEGGTSSSASSTSTPSSTADGGGLSAGAAAGIGAGVTVVVLAFAAGVFAWVWRRRKRNTMEDDGEGTTQVQDDGNQPEREQPKYVAQLVEGHQWQDQYWTQKASPVELSSRIAPVEIGSSQVRDREHELPV